MLKKAHRAAGLGLAFLLLIGAQIVAAGETITGRVVGVHDGDTATVLDASKKQYKIRFGQIDAPELRQDFGQVSKDNLSSLIFGKEVTVEVQDTDRYGRTVGRVIVGGKDANLEQVRAGMAWVYRQYSKDPVYLSAEDAAKAAKLGLWSRPDAVPPWEFRHGGKSSTGADRAGEASRASNSQARPVVTDSGSAEGVTPRGWPWPPSGGCAGKTRCDQMADCAEARHYLNDCGVSKLDKDGDGTPCESLCK